MKVTRLVTLLSTTVAAEIAWETITAMESWISTNNAIPDNSYINELILDANKLGDCTACKATDDPIEVIENSFIQIYWANMGGSSLGENSIKFQCIDGCDDDGTGTDPVTPIVIESVGRYTY